MNNSKVLLVTGPAGSGKSTLAQRVALELDWKYVEEDAYWVKNGWGSGIRTDAQEAEVQKQVLSDIEEGLAENSGFVLEFILYKDPPNPVTAYQSGLNEKNIGHALVALKPSVDEILRRMQERGRESDVENLEARRKDAQNQVNCLKSEYILQSIVDSSSMSVDELSAFCIEKISG